jgi:hypothetical protein
MTALTFAFQEVINEVDAFSHLAHDFIEPNSRFVLPQFKSELESYREQPTKDGYEWQIRPDFPLRTTVSRGEYEVGAEASTMFSLTSMPAGVSNAFRKGRESCRPDNLS